MRSQEQIRADFPSLSREVDGAPAAFFDGPAGSQVPLPVMEAMIDYLSHRNANTGGVFATSVESDEMLLGARRTLGTFLGGTGDGVVFGQNMTTLTYSVSRAMSRSWGAEDEIVVTDLDHQANVAPWVQAAEDAGATVRRAPFDPESCQLDMDRMREILGPRTRLVAVGYASNAVGTVNDVARVCGWAREVGAMSYVDAVHYAPHGVVDVEAIGCDFLACSAYKFFGPHIGILWGRPELLGSLEPYRLPPSSNAVPDRWETGTLSHEGIAGAAAAVEWIAGLGGGAGDARDRVVSGIHALERIEAPLFGRLLEGLGKIPGLRIHGPPVGAPRTPTLAFTLPGMTARHISELLAEDGIFVWDGDFYASSVIDQLGLRAAGGVVRVGMAPYNTAEEVDRLVESVGRVAAG